MDIFLFIFVIKMLHEKKIFTGRNMYRHKEKRSPMRKITFSVTAVQE